MKGVELYARVRRAVLVEGMSRREAARIFGIDRRTVDKTLVFSVPPGYRRSKPVRRPKLDTFTGVIDQILEADTKVPRKQRHTSKRIFERLRIFKLFFGQLYALFQNGRKGQFLHQIHHPTHKRLLTKVENITFREQAQ